MIKRRLVTGKEAGLTLIELLVSLAITAILVVTSIAGMHYILMEQRLKAAGEGFFQLLNYARTEALKQHLPVYVHWQTGSSWCVGANVNSTCTCTISGSCTLSNVSYTNFPSVTLSTNMIGANTVNYEILHGHPSITGTYILSSGSKDFRLNLNATGQVTVCSTSLSGYPAC